MAVFDCPICGHKMNIPQTNIVYRFFHAFDGLSTAKACVSTQLTDEQKIEIAKRRAGEDLARELMRNAAFEVTPTGDVKGYLRIGE